MIFAKRCSIIVIFNFSTCLVRDNSCSILPQLYMYTAINGSKMWYIKITCKEIISIKIVLFRILNLLYYDKCITVLIQVIIFQNLQNRIQELSSVIESSTEEGRDLDKGKHQDRQCCSPSRIPFAAKLFICCKQFFF